MRRLANLTLLWLLCSSVVGLAQEVAPPIAGRQVLTAEELRQAGVLRPSDLFRMLDGWTFSPRDGWHGDLNVGALGDSGWEVWIDGHRLTTPVLGAQDLNLLPISVEDIDFVEAVRHPTFASGVLAGSGTLHIHTKIMRARDRPRFGARASAWIGNESGDPGPLQFLGDDSPNVDHLGPDYTASAEWADRDLRVLGRLVRRKHYPTDAAILDRHQSITVGYPSMELDGAVVRIHVPGRTTQDFALQLSRLDDFYFLEPFGREIPTVTRRTFAGIRGEIPLDRTASIHYRAAFTAASLTRRPNLRNIDLDWSTERTDGAVELHFGRSIFDVQVGISMRSHVFRTFPALRDPSVTEMGAQVRVAGRNAAGPALALQLRDMAGRIALNGLFSMTGRPTRRHAYTVVLAYFERPAYEEHPLWYWMGRGYRLLDELEIQSTILHDPAPSRHFTLDARWRTDLSDQWSGTLGLLGRMQSEQTIALQTLRYETSDDSDGGFIANSNATIHGGISDRNVIAGPVTLAGPFAGMQYGFEAELNGTYRLGIRQDLYMRWLPVRAGDRSLRDAEGIWPRLELRARWYHRPVPGIGLSTQLSYRSATDWHGYDRTRTAGDPGEGGGRIDHLPPVWTLDLAGTKSLWRERIHLTMELRNVLNHAARYHPIGGRDDLSFSVRVVAEID